MMICLFLIPLRFGFRFLSFPSTFSWKTKLKIYYFYISGLQHEFPRNLVGKRTRIASQRKSPFLGHTTNRTRGLCFEKEKGKKNRTQRNLIEKGFSLFSLRFSPIQGVALNFSGKKTRKTHIKSLDVKMCLSAKYFALEFVSHPVLPRWSGAVLMILCDTWFSWPGGGETNIKTPPIPHMEFGGMREKRNDDDDAPSP